MKDKDQQHEAKPQHTNISGRFDQYRSSFWAAAVAVLSVRYALKPFARNHWETGKNFLAKHSYAAWTGGIMYATVGFYAWRTWKDMRNIFAEALAWEFDKSPDKVTFSDFQHSKNFIIRDTMKRYIKYNLRRALVNATFFMPFILKPLAEKYNWHGEAGVDAGMAANGVYLFSDVMSRRITPFEALQSTIDRKVNHVSSASDEITANDLLNIYEHAAEGTPHLFSLQRGTPRWEQSVKLFDRMAKLMNQTYHNEVQNEVANFTFPKLIYLIGNGLIDPDHQNRTRAYVEVANRYQGMKEVKEMQRSLREGQPVNILLQGYGVAPLPNLEEAAHVAAVSTPARPGPAYLAKQLRQKSNDDMSIAEREKSRRGDGLVEGMIL
jgi:hypothetical protein